MNTRTNKIYQKKRVNQLLAIFAVMFLICLPLTEAMLEINDENYCEDGCEDVCESCSDCLQCLPTLDILPTTLIDKNMIDLNLCWHINIFSFNFSSITSGSIDHPPRLSNI